MSIRVLVVDDEELVRFGLRTILESAEDITVIGEADDGTTAVEAATRLSPDVVLMDIRMPRTDGLTALRHILSGPQPPKVAILTTFHVDEYVFAALETGASGFLLKDTPPLAIIHAVRAIAAGSQMLSPAVSRRMIAEFVARRDHPRRAAARHQIDTLSERERQVLLLIAHGLSNAEVAGRLFMSEATVKTYVSRMLAKLSLDNRTQAAILCFEAGLLDSA